MNSDIKKYLSEKGIPYTERNSELITKCFFSNCDDDTKGNELPHLYFSIASGQYQCKKCSVSGNLITLKKHFGDFENHEQPKRNIRTITPALVEKYHAALTPEITSYLNERGVSLETIEKYKIGYGEQYGSWWIMFPIKDLDGNYSFFKLRQDPKYGSRKMTFPNGEAQIFDWQDIIMAQNKVMLVEGEMDALLMKSNDINAITSTHGAGTFKDEWIEHLNPDLEYFICYDNDEAGRNGSVKVASLLLKHGFKKIKIVTLPQEVGDKGDLGDYIIKLKLPTEDLFTKYAKEYPEKVDASEFSEITLDEVCKILDATIKKDDENKAITFLSMLNTYTEESQMNVFFNAPSSTGKSHIPLSVAELFPREDQIILANCSPTAFFHEQGILDKEKNEFTVDLSKKILIFTDMPNTGLMERLRSLLSHDAKESYSKITDKNQKGGNRTKNVKIIGYPSVYLCSASMKIDEQESTRFLMLSPSIEHEKITQGIYQAIAKESNREDFVMKIIEDVARNLLKKRILGIKQENISDVKIENEKLIAELFFTENKEIKPRQQRDIKKVMNLIKALALLNVWFRKHDGDYIFATDKDIRDGFELWNKVSEGQDHGLAPYVYDIYTKIIITLWSEPSEEWDEFDQKFKKKIFITRKEILKKHSAIYGRPLSMSYLRSQILPQLDQVGLILQEKNPNDQREMVVIPLETEL